MRIDPKNKIDGIYEINIKKNTSTSDNNIKKEKDLEKDRIEISKEASSYDKLSSIKSEIVSKVEKGTSADKLRRLKAEIDNGIYHISSNDIASAIINSDKKE